MTPLPPPSPVVEIIFHATPVVAAALPGQPIQFTIIAFTANDSELVPPNSGPNATAWSTSDSAVATVDHNGLLVGRSPGFVTLYAKVRGESAGFVFTVLPRAASAAIQVPSAQLVLPATFTAYAVLRSAAGDSLTTRFRHLKWSSSDSTIAKVQVDTSFGTLDALVVLTGFGTATLTLAALDEQVSGSVQVTVAPLLYRTVKFGGDDDNPGMACALNNSGHPFCWGRDAAGNDMPPGQFHASQTVVGQLPDPVPTELNTSLVFDSLVVSKTHACGLMHDGTVYCWGDNSSGQLGNATQTTNWAPVPVSGGHRFVALAAAELRTCGITADGSAFCWGNNSSRDDFGNGNIGETSVPVPAALGVQLRSISLSQAGQYGGASCGMTLSNIAVCWSVNTLGAVGIGQVTDTPVPPSPVQSPETLVAVTAGGEHSCGLTIDGRAYCWGNAFGGVLSLPSNQQGYPTPQLISGLTRFVQIDVALYHSCGISTDRNVWCWGDGWGTTPVLVPLPDPVADLRTSIWKDCAVTVRNEAWCWSGAAPTPLPLPGQSTH